MTNVLPHLVLDGNAGCLAAALFVKIDQRAAELGLEHARCDQHGRVQRSAGMLVGRRRLVQGGHRLGALGQRPRGQQSQTRVNQQPPASGQCGIDKPRGARRIGIAENKPRRHQAAERVFAECASLSAKHRERALAFVAPIGR